MNEFIESFVELFTDYGINDPVIISIFGFFGFVLFFKAICSLIHSVTSVWR